MFRIFCTDFFFYVNILASKITRKIYSKLFKYVEHTYLHKYEVNCQIFIKT